jgi:hypothetical protein
MFPLVKLPHCGGGVNPVGFYVFSAKTVVSARSACSQGFYRMLSMRLKHKITNIRPVHFKRVIYFLVPK